MFQSIDNSLIFLTNKLHGITNKNTAHPTERNGSRNPPYYRKLEYSIPDILAWCIILES